MLWKTGYSRRAVQAAEWLVALEERRPSLPPKAWFNFHIFARSAYGREERERAISFFQRSLALGSRNQEDYAALIYLLEKEGRSAETGPVYEGILALAPPEFDDAEYARIGKKLLDLGRLEGAADAYRRAVARNPRNIVARTNLGWSLYLSGDYAEAADEYEAVLEIAPNSVAMFNLGLARAARGDLEDARQIYARAIADYGAEEGRRIGAVQDLLDLEKRGQPVAREILNLFWPEEER